MSNHLQGWLVVLGIFAGALVVGFIVDRVVIALLKHRVGPAQRVRTALSRALAWQSEIWAVLLAFTVLRPYDQVPANQVALVDRVMVVLAVLSVTLFIARLSGWLIRAYISKETVTAPSGSIFVNLTRMLIWAIGLTFMLGAMGVQIGPLVASLGVVGLAVSLGLQDTLANFFSGLQITMSRQIQPGNYIRLASAEEGTVVDVTWRNTTLLAPSNDLIIVPNSVIARAQLTNFTAEDEEHTVVVPFVVRYGGDLDEVKRVALSVAEQVRDELGATVKDFEPACRFRSFSPDGISAAVTMGVERYQDRLPVVSELVERLYVALTAAGIELGAEPVAPAPARPKAVSAS